MEIKKLIEQLQECLKDGKTHLTLLANQTNGEDTDYDLIFNDLEVWNDGDKISVNIAGTFAADKFITLTNKSKNPVISSQPITSN